MMKMIFAMMALALPAVSAWSASHAVRGLHVADLVAVETIEPDSFRFAPDGSALAFEMVRPLETHRRLPAELSLTMRVTEVEGHARSDVWVQESTGRPARNLTQGLQDGSGWWGVQWSPNGSRLAMLSTRGGHVAIWIWDRKTGALRELPQTRNTDIRVGFCDADPASCAYQNFLWVDGARVVSSVLKNAEVHYPIDHLTLPRGTELTASALDSGTPFRAENLPHAEIRLSDTGGEAFKTLAEPIVPPNSRLQWHLLSRSAQRLALMTLIGLERPRDGAPWNILEDVSPQYSVELYTLQGTRLPLDWERQRVIVPGSLRWSAGGRQLEFLAAGEAGAPAERWAAEPSTDRDRGGYRVRRVEASGRKAEASAESAARRQWERSARKPSDGALLVEFSTLHDAAIYVEDGRRGLFVWRVDTQSGATETILSANKHLPTITAGEMQALEYTSLDGEPLKGVLLLPVGYEQGKRYPLVCWVYAGEDASNLASYQRRYGLGRSFGGAAGVLNAQLLATKGYAVLFPSMPLKELRLAGGIDGPDDPLLRFTSGVLPAIDRAVALGVADAQRVFALGHSYGGHTTYALVTQTNRFRAAAALNGFTNLVSAYGTFDVRKRYTDNSHEQQNVIGHHEVGQARMGNPPWKDLGRYLRNSPIQYVDRVETPLLLVHGELDFLPIQQAEEFFTSLYRRGKRAQFARYWGEEHLVKASAANVRDMWARIFAWFDEHGDVSRDERGELVFAGERVASRNGGPALTPADFMKLEDR